MNTPAVPMPLPLDEVKCFPGPSGMEYTCAPGDDYYNAADLQAYGDAREAYALANLSARPGAGVDAEADMFWDDDNPEMGAESVWEVVNARIEYGAKAGTIFEVQQAIRLPNITVQITIECGDEADGSAEYGWREVLTIAAATKEPK